MSPAQAREADATSCAGAVRAAGPHGADGTSAVSGAGRGRAALDAALLDAHAVRDGARLVRLYAEAARLAEASSDAEAACFYLTHAYVFALETGAPEAAALHRRLVEAGREE